MNEPTAGQIAKLPKWAQEHIKSISRERDEANKVLQEFTDAQTESPFSYQEFRGTDPSSGEGFPVRYIQTHKVLVSHEGLEVEVMLPMGTQGRGGVEISFSAKPGLEAVIVPRCSNGITILPAIPKKD